MYRPYERDWERWDDKPQKGPRNLWTGAAAPVRVDFRTIIHPLVLCPPIAQGTHYQLVVRRWGGERQVLAMARARSRHAGLNLARVRQAAAKLGAGEVHILPMVQPAGAKT